MSFFNFLLQDEATSNPLQSILTFGIIGVLLIAFYLFMMRPQKKREKKEAEMRNALAVGDEVTTIGGIIGKVVSIKGETFVLETTKDKTKIRFLRGAIRSVDVKAQDIANAVAAEAGKTEDTAAPAEENVSTEKPAKRSKKSKTKAEEAVAVEAPAATVETEKTAE